MIRIGSLFSGCGGLDMGIEAALGPDAETVWQVEKDPYATKVLEKHWPNAERYTDVRAVGSHNLSPCDVLIGGFPCTEVSISNNKWGDPDKVGLEGDNSGLWREMYRIIREMEPRGVVIENVPALADRGLGQVLGDLMALSGLYRYIEWDCLSAKAVGARHRRDRIFIICHNAANPMRKRLEGQQLPIRTKEKYSWVSDPCRWATEPPMDRVANGVRDRAHRLRLLGNAVVPQVAYQVGLAYQSTLSPTSPENPPSLADASPYNQASLPSPTEASTNASESAIPLSKE